jgi:hypothetical protein
MCLLHIPEIIGAGSRTDKKLTGLTVPKKKFTGKNRISRDSLRSEQNFSSIRKPWLWEKMIDGSWRRQRIGANKYSMRRRRHERCMTAGRGNTT